MRGRRGNPTQRGRRWNAGLRSRYACTTLARFARRLFPSSLFGLLGLRFAQDLLSRRGVAARSSDANENFAVSQLLLVLLSAHFRDTEADERADDAAARRADAESGD